jgi:hypothetical protein
VVAIPKLREGCYFPDWLLERRKRAEKALVSVVATRLSARRLHPPNGEAELSARTTSSIRHH